MGMGLDHCIHCAFHVLCSNMRHDCVMCYVNYMHGKMYMEKKGTLGLKNITLGVRKRMKGKVQDVEVY